MSPMPLRATLFILLLATAVLNAGGRSTTSESIDFERETASHVYELNSPDGADAARLEVRARVGGGEVTFQLLDPSGEERLNGHGLRGNLELDTGKLETPLPGVWRLTVKLDGATGRYDFDWASM